MKDFLIRRLLGIAGSLLLQFISYLRDAGVFSGVVEMAQAYVLDAESGGKTGDEKRKEVFDRIKASLQSQGKTLSVVAINLAIELAVAALQAQLQKK